VTTRLTSLKPYGNSPVVVAAVLSVNVPVGEDHW
jgi:hypothetical protein